MITYIELWSARQAWLDLPQQERVNYLTALAPAIQQLLDEGVQIVSWGSNEASTFSKVAYDYFAVWTFPTMESARSFEKLVAGAGWYTYFDQVNASGNLSTPQEVIEQLIAL